jgi:hypothetical protein
VLSTELDIGLALKAFAGADWNIFFWMGHRHRPRPAWVTEMVVTTLTRQSNHPASLSLVVISRDVI